MNETILTKICKTCNIEKTIPEFKKSRRHCRKCDSKMNYEKYKDKFKIYYANDQEHRCEYQKQYGKLKRESMPAKKRGRPRKINVIIEIVKDIVD